MNSKKYKTIKILSLIMIIVIFIVSCNNNVKTNETNSPNNTANPIESDSPSFLPSEIIPEDVNEANNLKIIYTADSTGKYYGLSDWQTYIQEKYGFEIYVSYKSLSADSIFRENILVDGILYLKYHESFVSSYNTEVLKLSDKNFAYNLAPYYEKYGWDKFVDKNYMDSLNIDGSIYAVLASDMKYIVPRFYNNRYLDELDMEVPESIPQFYEYLQATKKLNAKDATFYPMVIFPMYTLCTADIFRAYGVYFNSIMNNARTYNPNTGSFEDGVYSENIEEAVGFIRTLQSERLLSIYDIFEETTLGVFNKELATEYNVVYNTKKFGFSPYILAESAYERTNGYFLTHINDTNVCEIRNDLAFYMFPKTIKDINGTIELFNRLFTDSEYFADLRYGIEDRDYFVIDGIPIKQQPMAGVLLNLKPIKPIEDMNAGFTPESVGIAANLSEVLSFESNVFNQKNTYSDRGENRDVNNDDAIEFLFDKELSPYDAIKEYRDDFSKQGRLLILNELNERIGAITTFDYGD